MNTPPVADPFGSVPTPIPPTPAIDARLAQEAGLPYRDPVAKRIVCDDGPMADRILRCFGTEEAADTTIDALMGAIDIKAIKARAEAAEKLLAPVTALADQVPSLQLQLQSEQQMVQTLRTLAQQAQAAPAKPAEPAIDPDTGKPLGEFQLLPVDPYHTDMPWAQRKLIPRLTNKWGQQVIALVGGAGTSKTWTVEQLCAAWAMPTLILNCKGSEPNDWYAYRSVINGETIWTEGRLTAAIRAAGDKKCCIFIDEYDTSSGDFQYRSLSLFNTAVSQRRIETEAGSLAVGPNIQFILAMNGNGKDPGSRHRGSVPDALFSRATWVEAEMMTAQELEALLAKRFALMVRDDVTEVASTILGLMNAQNRGVIDADITVRTAVKVCQDWDMGSDLAWAGALTDGLTDRKMRDAALAIISTKGK